MRVAFLAPANSIHTQRWVLALARRGHQVTLFSQHAKAPSEALTGIAFEKLPHSGEKGYILNAWYLRSKLNALAPDLLNVHYASGYGTTAALSGFHPSLLSVWGSDVFDFPYESWWKGLILRRNLRLASRIASTSQVMANQVGKLVPALAVPWVTPFGVDCSAFRPMPCRDDQFITVGTVKTLAHKYGVDLLITAFATVFKELHHQNSSAASRLRLVLVGGGDQRAALEALASSLGIGDKVTFVGPVAHADVPIWLNRLDIFVAASRLDSESFGVAAVEAGACGLPVVVSDAGGLPEVVQNGKTGFVVPRENPQALADAIGRLVRDADLRDQIGRAGRDFVLANYEWEHCVDTMEAAYRDVVAAHGTGQKCQTQF